MDAKSLVSALIARYVDERGTGVRSANDRRPSGRIDALIWAAELAYGWDEEQAEQYVAEEVQERIASMV